MDEKLMCTKNQKVPLCRLISFGENSGQCYFVLSNQDPKLKKD